MKFCSSITLIFIITATSNVAFSQGDGKASPKINSNKNFDISQILDQKFEEYDKSRRNTHKGNTTSLSLDYNTKNHSNDGVINNYSTMQEQQVKLNNFRNFNYAPHDSRGDGFYGFSLAIPLKSSNN